VSDGARVPTSAPSGRYGSGVEVGRIAHRSKSVMKTGFPVLLCWPRSGAVGDEADEADEASSSAGMEDSALDAGSSSSAREAAMISPTMPRGYLLLL